MILSLLTLNSKSLGKQTEVNVLLPAVIDKPLRTLWLLHGMRDDHSGWLRKSFIEVLADKYGIAIVMPNGDLSFYVDMIYGGDYCSWIGEELPEKLQKLLPFSPKKEDNFISGISMGGYGAFYIAMNRPERFHAAASLSGPMRIDWINRTLTNRRLAEAAADGDREGITRECKSWAESQGIPQLLVNSLAEMSSPLTVKLFEAMFGINPILTGNHYDIFHLAEELKNKKGALKLLAWCGEHDYHYESNLLFRDHAAESGLNYHLITGEGAHTWEYWNRVIPHMMKCFFGDSDPSL
jgi:S-formylglutathione hydrolase FrmB